MERLTEYFECGAYTEKQNIVDTTQVAEQFFEKGVIIGKAIDKLAEYEDFMEEHGYFGLLDLEKDIERLKSENKALKKSKKQRGRSKIVNKGEINDSTRAKTKSNSYV